MSETEGREEGVTRAEELRRDGFVPIREFAANQGIPPSSATCAARRGHIPYVECSGCRRYRLWARETDLEEWASLSYTPRGASQEEHGGLSESAGAGSKTEAQEDREESLQVCPVTYYWEDSSIRTSVGEDGSPLFCVVDVCASLGIRKTWRALVSLRDRGYDVVMLRLSGPSTRGDGQTQPIAFTDLGAINYLVFRSKKPEAQRFTRWVTQEVLPSIYRTGSYSVAASFATAPSIAQIRLLAEHMERQQNLLNTHGEILLKSIELHEESARDRAELWDEMRAREQEVAHLRESQDRIDADLQERIERESQIKSDRLERETKLEEAQQALKDDLKKLTEVNLRLHDSIGDYGGPSLRSLCNMIIRSYCRDRALEYRDVWRVIYQRMLYQHHIDVRRRKKNAQTRGDLKGRSGLDFLQEDELTKLFGVVMAYALEMNYNASWFSSFAPTRAYIEWRRVKRQVREAHGLESGLFPPDDPVFDDPNVN